MIAAHPSVRLRAARFWREYTRMRTAIFFLIGVVAIVAVGSFVPQDGTSDPTKVQAFIANNPSLTSVFGHIGLPLTTVFVSPIFYVLLGSLYIALGACVLRRGRALLLRTFKRYPRTPQYWGEIGSWVFHSSLFLLLVAVVWGKATGYQGLVTVVDGQSFTETRAGYDQLQEGLLFNGQHAGFTMRLNSFKASYAGSGEASDYVSNVTVFDHGRALETKDIRVNDFLGYGGVNVYQQDYGWAPTITVTNPQGQTVFSGPIQFFDDPSAVGNKSESVGVLKVPDFNYTIPGAREAAQIGARMAMFPDAKVLPQIGAGGTIDPSLTEYGPGGLAPNNPVIELQLFVGDLGLNGGQAQNVNVLDTSKMQPFFSDAHVVGVPLGGNFTFAMPGANGAQLPFTVSFAGLQQYSLFQVNKDSGVPLIYTTFVLIMVGLLAKLYARPLLERRERRRTHGVIRLDPRWTSSVSGEPQPAPDARETERV
ncbi:MAG: cytochrome c biogenesis protein ResB [Candidatus Dormibacteria bacterium]